MSENKEVTMQDVRKLLLGLEPITKKNLLSFTNNKTPQEAYNHIRGYLRRKGLDTKEGMQAYVEKRQSGCKGCGK